ncbi:hypothetical protein [uncultured Muriicola sp.]|uniref:hypothetical protein n=1 Tax=uncultured Muriicola sp. TaxID=1583102 RepID=UPI00260EB6B1|nr:hypothetical protein [uncultured Muriicola sp.]
MSKYTYYPTMFHTNPFAYNWTEILEAHEMNAKELILKNTQATQLGVAEMFLSISKFSAFDIHGNEHFIKEFPKQAELNPKGMHTEFFIKIKSMLELEEGGYTTFRFYLGKNGNRLSYKDGRSETITDVKYLDFEIKNGLRISGDKNREVVLRFDFTPFTLGSYFRPILNLFKRSKTFTGKLAGSLGS